MRIVQAAVGERTGLVGMTIDRGMTQNQICNDSDSLLTVPVLILDRSGLLPPDLIKMDVEGAESAVLKGAQKILHEVRPAVFVALHCAIQRDFCGSLLKQAGYAIYDLGGAALNGLATADEIYALPRESISK